MEESVIVSLLPPDNVRLANLCGALDNNITQLARSFDVDISRRGERFSVRGRAAKQAANVLQALYARATHGLEAVDVQLAAARAISENGDMLDLANHASAADNFSSNSHPSNLHNSTNTNARTRNNFSNNVAAKATNKSRASSMHSARPERHKPIRTQTMKHNNFMAQTPAQEALMQKILQHDIVFCTGPAGAGKSHIALAAALRLLHDGVHERLILSRPAVEAGGERIGFLPGDMEQKVNPYLRPLRDILYRLLGRRDAERRMSEGQIEILPLSFMRGLTIDHSVLILDEAQNTTPAQLKMTLTRLGANGRVIVTGDESQSDLPSGDSGLSDAVRRMHNIQGIAIHRFCESDIVRHPLVRQVLRAYNNPPQSNSLAPTGAKVTKVAKVETAAASTGAKPRTVQIAKTSQIARTTRTAQSKTHILKGASKKASKSGSKKSSGRSKQKSDG